MTDPPAIAAAAALGLEVEVTRHGPVRSLAEAADARGVTPHQGLSLCLGLVLAP